VLWASTLYYVIIKKYIFVSVAALDSLNQTKTVCIPAACPARAWFPDAEGSPQQATKQTIGRTAVTLPRSLARPRPYSTAVALVPSAIASRGRGVEGVGRWGWVTRSG
jgi:hypothetical protein